MQHKIIILTCCIFFFVCCTLKKTVGNSQNISLLIVSRARFVFLRSDRMLSDHKKGRSLTSETTLLIKFFSVQRVTKLYIKLYVIYIVC